jgi:glycine cleavage system regulatory protein
MGKKQSGLIAELAKEVLSKKANGTKSKYSCLGKELMEALKSGDSEKLGELLRDQVGIAVADALKDKDGGE